MPAVKRLRRIFLVTLGLAAVVLGVIGIFLPLLPTTPFLLLAAWCFVRSSRRLHDWLLGHRILGKYIHHYLVYHAVPLRAKIVAVSLLWVTLVVSMLLVRQAHLVILLAVVGAAVTIHILTLATLRRDAETNTWVVRKKLAGNRKAG